MKILSVFPEEIWACISSFLPNEETERCLRCTCLTFQQLLSSEKYYQVKVMDTYPTKELSEWPSVGAWRTLHSILAEYVALEGWYIICNAWPWGLLVLCRFDGGKFCGDLVRAFPRLCGSRDISRYCNISERIFEISFENIQPHCKLISRTARSFGVLESEVSHVTSSTTFPRNGGFLFQISDICSIEEETTGTINLDSSGAGDSIPGVRDLIEGILENKLLLEYLHGPSGRQFLSMQQQTHPIHIEASMPLIKPGLYVGDYGSEYGHFRHEILQVRYLDSRNVKEAFGGRIPEDFSPSPKVSIFISARKVTGDIHVPTGEVTWCADISAADLDANRPKIIKDNQNVDHRVQRAWPGWGTLALPNFCEPDWDKGWLLQLEDDEYDGTSRFAFSWSCWNGDECIVLNALPNCVADSYLWSSIPVKMNPGN